MVMPAAKWDVPKFLLRGSSHPSVSTKQRKRKMARETSEEERLTEDEIARRILGPRGVPGDPDTAKMTPQQEKKFPKQATSTAIPPDWAQLRFGASQPIPFPGSTAPL